MRLPLPFARCLGGSPHLGGLASAAAKIGHERVGAGAGWPARLLFCAVLMSMNVGFAQSTRTPAAGIRFTEAGVKAAYLINFALFVDWPDDRLATAETPITIGVLGSDAVLEGLKSIAPLKTVKQRKIVIRNLAGADEAGDCHVAFFGGRNESATVLGKVVSRSVLLVGEQSDFAAAGGMIQLMVVDESVRFDVNLRAIRRSDLKAGSQMLGAARKILYLNERN
jgi:hypothetical protein